MPIPLPNLDDRRWADLVDDGRTLLPVYSPQWTDFNTSDPGITLMELFAAITELDIYQINRIPERHKRKFLELVGIEPYPPRAARTILQATVNSALHLPSRTEFQLTGKGFSTLYPVDLVPSSLTAVQSGAFTDLSAVLQGKPVEVSDALYLGFDRELPKDARVSLYFANADPTSGWKPIVREQCDTAAACHQSHPCGCHTGSSSTSQLRRHHSVELAWEYLDAANFWQPLAVKDATRALTLDGHVWFTAPAAMRQAVLGRVAAPCYWIRARVASGSFDAPVRLRGIFSNAIECDQSTSVAADWKLPPDPPAPELQPAGTGNGAPFQSIALMPAPVVRSGVRVFSYENNLWIEWTRREDFDASSPAALHFKLDATTGIVTFGSGKHGRVPPAGTNLFATYRATLAERGNLDATQPATLSDSFHNRFRIDVDAARNSLAAASNPLPATGGTAAETLAHAISSAIADREAVHRAITLTDYETLALTTPGTRIARVKAWANTHPILNCLEAPGVITVIVVPSSGAPSPGLLSAVHRYLFRRRPIGTRVEVIGPSFLKISVTAQVQSLPKQDPARVRQAVIATLTRFFDLLLGGPEAGGWPFGRDVYRSEVLQAIDGTPGVDHVVSLDVTPENCAPQCGNVCLKPSWLTVSGQHQIEVV